MDVDKKAAEVLNSLDQGQNGRGRGGGAVGKLLSMFG